MLECTACRVAVAHHDRRHRLAHRGLERLLEAGVDLDEIGDGADDTVHSVEPLHAGVGPDLVEGEAECLGPSGPPVDLGGRGPDRVGRRRRCGLGLGETFGGRVEGGDETVLGLGLLGEAATQLVGLLSPLDLCGLEGGHLLVESSSFSFGTSDRVTDRTQLTTDLGSTTGDVGDEAVAFVVERLLLDDQLLLALDQLVDLGSECHRSLFDHGQLVADLGPFGLQTGHEIVGEGGAAVTLEAPATLGQHRGEAQAAFTQRLVPRQCVTDVVADRSQTGFGRHDADVEFGQLGADLRVVLTQAGPLGLARLETLTPVP